MNENTSFIPYAQDVTCFLETAIWALSNNLSLEVDFILGHNRYANYSPSVLDFTPSTIQETSRRLAAFRKAYASALNTWEEHITPRPAFARYPNSWPYYLCHTANGNKVAGFWSEDTPVSAKLTEAALEFGSFQLIQLKTGQLALEFQVRRE